MEEKIIQLSETCNSLEISRILNLALKEVEIVLVNYYYKDNFKISKDSLVECADRIYFESPTTLGSEFNISEVTLKKYLNICKLFNDKKARINVNDNKITQTLINSVIEDYNNCLSITQLMSKYHLSKNKVKDILHSNDVSTSKITFNDTVFDVIDTEEKAYWLGFLYADGYVSSRDNTVELSLKILDAKHLFKFKQFLNAKRDIKLDFKVGRCRFSIRSNHFKEQLINLDCTPNKSLILKFPTEDQVPTKYIIPFIRGYYDGDGILSYTLRNKTISIISTGMLGTEDFLLEMFEHLPKLNHRTLLKANKEGAEECKVVSWSKNDSIYLLNQLYNNANIYLDRKYKRYLFFKENDFAVLKSDLLDNDRAISEDSKQWINKYFKIDFDSMQENSEITEEIKESSAS